MNTAANYALDSEEQSPEARLWTAVVVQAIEEWQSGPLRASRKAEEFLFRDAEDFQMVCEAAGFDPARLREKLAKLPKRINEFPIGVERLVA